MFAWLSVYSSHYSSLFFVFCILYIKLEIKKNLHKNMRVKLGFDRIFIIFVWFNQRVVLYLKWSRETRESHLLLVSSKGH